MTAHSPQAIAAYPDTQPGDVLHGQVNRAEQRTAFDRGRAETLAEVNVVTAELIEFATASPYSLTELIQWSLSLIRVGINAPMVLAGLSALPVVVESPTARSDSINPSAITYSEAEFSKMMAERDEWYERLDKLIYSLATVEQIGEWSSANDPVAEFEQLIHDERASRPLLDSTDEDSRALPNAPEKFADWLRENGYASLSDSTALIEAAHYLLAKDFDVEQVHRVANGLLAALRPLGVADLAVGEAPTNERDK